jgi:glucose/arabinose dehydrogenase
MSLLLSLAALAAGQTAAPPLPKPFDTPSVTKHPKVLGWPAGKAPTAPAGFAVTAFAADLDNPRWPYVLPNGDVLVAESRTLPPKKPKPDANPADEKGKRESKTVTGGSANRITLLRDADGDGSPEVRETLLDGLNQPFGMALLGDTLFVANTDAVLAFPFKVGETKITTPGRKVLDLPAGGYNNHWTRNLLASKDGTKLYVTVGSGSNVAEHGTANELLRACVLEANPDGTGLRVFAGGLRNPVGLAWEPASGALWTAVNERDHLGDDLVPDYMTSVRDGAFYGWPWAYAGTNEDPRRKGERPDLVAKSVAPDVPLGAHTASLGLAFYTADKFPAKYRGGAFVGQRGSWNRSQFAGYKVAFVPFQDGKPAGGPEEFLTGFLVNDNEAYGRPVGVAVAKDGALLVTDDAGNRVWRVAAK